MEWLSDNISGMPSGVSSAVILISAAVNSGTATQTDVRVDAQVTWLPPKPAGLTVPAADTVAVVSIVETEPPQPAVPSPPPRSVTVTDPATLDTLRSAADGLPTALPGARSCPATFGTEYAVAFALGPGDAPNTT
ncbi:MAG: hypothetical protein ACRDYC_07860, partial [Acidimicrobiales bacterium]